MTAIFGFRFLDGVFVAADSVRTNLTTMESEHVRKIHTINNHVYSFSSGLGDYGDVARAKLLEVVNTNHNIDEIVALAQPIYRDIYAQSLRDYPGHNQRLVLGLFGVDPYTAAGRVQVISDNYENFVKWSKKLVRLSLEVVIQHVLEQSLVRSSQKGILQTNCSLMLLH